VRVGTDRTTTRQDELLERRERVVPAVDPPLESRDVFVAHPIHALPSRLGGRGQIRTDVEQIVLDPLQTRVDLACGLATGLLVLHPNDPEDGVEFVYGSVGLDSGVILGNLSAANQIGGAPIADPSVHACDAQALLLW